MSELLHALSQFVGPLGDLIAALAALLLPWTPLAAWIAFWLLAVNWVKLRVVLAEGGWVGVALLAVVAVLVWGNLAPTPAGAPYDFMGLKVSNFVEKTVYVSGLVCIMFLAGSVQLTGCCGDWCKFSEPEPEDDHGHGHDGHGHDSHGHDSHGHVLAVAPAAHDHH